MTTQVSSGSLRDRIGRLLRDNRLAIGTEILIVPLFFALQVPARSILFVLIGWLSLWLRRSGWRHIGMNRPVSWRRTVLLGVGIGVVYNVLDIAIIVPLLHRLTGESLDLSQFDSLRNNFTVLLFMLAVVWIKAGFGEEMAYRGYILNRLADFFGRGKAGWTLGLMISAFFFGFAHGYQGITGMADTLLFGVLAGVLYLTSGRNLWLPVIAHGVMDTMTFTLIFLGLYP